MRYTLARSTRYRGRKLRRGWAFEIEKIVMELYSYYLMEIYAR